MLALQGALTQLGYDPGGADGNYGSGTTQAVKEFQAAQGLTQDGIAGPATLTAINEAARAAGCEERLAPLGAPRGARRGDPASGSRQRPQQCEAEEREQARGEEGDVPRARRDDGRDLDRRHDPDDAEQRLLQPDRGARRVGSAISAAATNARPFHDIAIPPATTRTGTSTVSGARVVAATTTKEAEMTSARRESGTTREPTRSERSPTAIRKPTPSTCIAASTSAAAWGDMPRSSLRKSTV